MVTNVKYLMTVADLEALPYDETHRYELIDGELYVSPAPGIPHQLVLNNLLLELGIYLRQHAVGTVVPGPDAVLSNHDWVIPDIVFVTKERWDSLVTKDRFYGAPDLMIEILSPGNWKRDLTTKRKLYGNFGVQEYWVVDVRNRALMIFRLNGDMLEEVRTIRDDDQLESPLLPRFSIPVRTIFN
jgi:Uma2 family endonuclease